MQKAVFYGASDDLIEVEGVKGGDEFNVYRNSEGRFSDAVHAAFNVGGKVRVYALYDGCWHFSAGQVDEGIPFPDWPFRVTFRDGYTMQLEIEVPNDVKVFLEWPDRGDDE